MSHGAPPARWPWRVLGLMGAVLALAGASLGVAAEAGPPAAALSHYVLGPGDGIRVVVFGENDLSGEFSIGTTGLLDLPLVGSVPAGGKTPGELSQTIAAALSPNYLRDPRVSVEVIKYRPFFILGEVKAPGSYPYAAELSVRSAAALAGGYTYRAKTGHAYITRVVEGHESKQRVSPETPVLPGDIIEVPERFF